MIGILVFVGDRGDSGLVRSSVTPFKYVGLIKGLDISICRSVSGVLRLPPKKSFFVENLRAREEPEVVVGVVRVEEGAEGGGAVNI